MQKPILHTINKNSFWLSPERCMYWEEEKALIVADLHFGKTGHFRKSGIAVPQNVYKEDLQRLVSQLQHFRAKQLIVVGDLFHSDANKELDLFKRWRKDLTSLKIHLVKGNHDILHNDWYEEAALLINNEQLIINNFCFIHDVANSFCRQKLVTDAPKLWRQSAEDDARLTTGHSSLYSFSGHIHPGIHIRGAAKQSLRLPCFYFTKEYAVLPAFSRFTGTHAINPGKNEKVFAIADDQIMQLA